MNIGDIYILNVPFTNMNIEKPRPVIIISEENSKNEILVLCGTSKEIQWNEDYIFTVSLTDLINEQLTIETVFPLSKQVLVASHYLVRKIDALKPDKLKALLDLMMKRQTCLYYKTIHEPKQNTQFNPGTCYVPYGGRVYDEQELVNLVDSSLEFWLTTGRYAKEFEDRLAKFIGVKHAYLVNSGSSANLLAFMALTSHTLGERKINRGDEVITVAAGFPTTVSPIVQYGAIPVFVDVELTTYNIDCDQLEKAVSPKTKAIMIAHTLGNPFDVDRIQAFCKKYNLWLIEDNCDALGSEYQGKRTGTFGDIATCSFYPPHHMTMGEGGAVLTSNTKLAKILLSMRDWGRDCSCGSGQDNLCGNRFTQQFGDLPLGYDHKYVYSHFGYNLKVTDMQAAIGCAQLDKLESFIQARRENHQYLLDKLKDLKDQFILPYPQNNSIPSWFGFLLTVKDGAAITREAIVTHLEKNHIQTRMLFAGNLTKHPCFNGMKEGVDYRVVGNLTVTDTIMRDTFWVGVYPGMTREKLEFVVAVIINFFNYHEY